MDIKYIFVYGTLKKNKTNHNSFLGNAKFIGEAKTDKQWGLVDLGHYPAMIMSHKSVEGELYEIDEHTLARIDNLEGVGYTGMYSRFAIPVFVDGVEYPAWTYIMYRSEFHRPISEDEIKSSW